MPRVAVPIAFHPRLQFRYAIYTSKIPGAVIHARSAEQPSFDNHPVKIDYMSNYFKMKGKTEWNDIKLTCYSFEGITENELYAYFNRDHFRITEGTEKFADDYKHIIQIYMLSPMVIPTARWRLFGAFISNASWGSMDYASDDIIQCEITISYDYAELS